MSPVLSLVLWLPVLSIIAWASRRLLGVRHLSLSRTVLAVVAGVAAASPAVLGADRRGAAAGDVIAIGIVLSVVFTMVAILVLDLLSRPGLCTRQARPLRRSVC